MIFTQPIQSMMFFCPNQNLVDPPPMQRLVHFDLKGAPPKVEYLKKVLKLSAGLGATGVLMEYEDMFPFTGKLGKAAATNHYSAAEVKELLDDCQALGLTVIPLVQTFGEFWQCCRHR